jgi:hypothetical protein
LGLFLLFVDRFVATTGPLLDWMYVWFVIDWISGPVFRHRSIELPTEKTERTKINRLRTDESGRTKQRNPCVLYY